MGLFGSKDTNNTGKISFGQFLDILAEKRRKVRPEVLQALYKRYPGDSDTEAVITQEEFLELMHNTTRRESIVKTFEKQATLRHPYNSCDIRDVLDVVLIRRENNIPGDLICGLIMEFEMIADENKKMDLPRFRELMDIVKDQ